MTALNPNAVFTGVYDGAAYVGDINLAPPVSGLSDDLGAFGYTNLGYLSNENPPELTLPGEAESTAVRAWQGARVIRVIRTPNEEQPTWDITLIQQDAAVLRLAFGTDVTELGPGEVRYVINGNVEREHFRFVMDVIAGTGVARYYAPNAVVVTVGALVFDNSGEPLGYPVTISCDYSPEIGGQIAVWQRTLTAADLTAINPIGPGDLADLPSSPLTQADLPGINLAQDAVPDADGVFTPDAAVRDYATAEAIDDAAIEEAAQELVDAAKRGNRRR